MRAIILERFGEPTEVLTVGQGQKPEPGRDEVRVRMLASPINPSDLMAIRGRYLRKPKLPGTPGFEGVGIIDAAGPGWLNMMRRLRPGKKVVVLNSTGGNWQDYVLVSARNVIPVGALPDAQAATFFVNPATALVMVERVLQVPHGAWLLQTAAGSALGQMVQRLGQKRGFLVINVVRREQQAQEMRAAGLTVVSGPAEGIPDQVMKITDGKGVKYAIDAVGGDTAVAAAKSLGSRGRLLLYGSLCDDPIRLDVRVLMNNQSSIEGFWLSEWAKEQGIFTMLGLTRQIASLLREGVLATEVDEFPLEQIKDAARQAEAVGRKKKVLLRIASQ